MQNDIVFVAAFLACLPRTSWSLTVEINSGHRTTSTETSKKRWYNTTWCEWLNRPKYSGLKLLVTPTCNATETPVDNFIVTAEQVRHLVADRMHSKKTSSLFCCLTIRCKDYKTTASLSPTKLGMTIRLHHYHNFFYTYQWSHESPMHCLHDLLADSCNR